MKLSTGGSTSSEASESELAGRVDMREDDFDDAISTSASSMSHRFAAELDALLLLSARLNFGTW